MIQFKLTYQTLKVDIRKYTEEVTNKLEILYRAAAREFLIAALNRIPKTVWSTGFSAFGFLNLAEEIGGTLGGVIHSVGGVRTRGFTGSKSKTITGATRRLKQRPSLERRKLVKKDKKRVYIKINPYYYGAGSKMPRTPDNARLLSTQPGEIFTKTDRGIIFSYGIDIDYFRIQDISRLNSPTSPWEAMKAGREAFIGYLDKNVESIIPEISKWIVVTEHTIDPSGGITRRKL